MMDAGIDLSIIVVNWNTCALLERCLQAVYRTVHGLAFEVLVVDNASTDGSALMVQQCFPQARLIQNLANAGFARANNQAIQVSQGRSLLLLNSDAFLSGDAVYQMAAFLDREKTVGVVGPGLVFEDGSLQVSSGSLPTLLAEVSSLLGLDKLQLRRKPDREPAASVETGWVSGACMLVRRSTLDKVGLLDERFFFFNEEVDLCCRIKNAGWKVCYLPALQVTHIGGGSTGIIPGRLLLLYQGKMTYFAKHLGRPSAHLYRAVLWLATVIKWAIYSLLALLGRNKENKGDLWVGVLQGLGNLHP